MRYKERHPTPHFKIPPPFNAVTGQYASLTGEIGVSPYCVLMQVAAEDTYADYVICRGFDTRMLVFVDYEEGNPDKPGISVAKPYGKRTANTYKIGEIYPALLPIQGNATYTPPSPTEINLRLGQNPGVVDGTPESGGQPSNLLASLALLYDHNGIAVNWLMIAGPTACEDLPKPGSYQAIAGGSITAGTVGPIVYGGTVYQVKNHSRCDVLFGHEVGFHVDPDCNAFFVPCVCCDEVPGDCCDKSYSICINAQTHILKPWSVSPFRSDIAVWKLCCLTQAGFTFGADSTYWLTGYLECDPLDNVIYFNWVIHLKGWTGADGQGRIELAGLCENGTSVTTLDNETTSVKQISCRSFSGFHSIIVHASDSLLECEEGCTGEPTTEGCCTKFLWFCINGNSQQLSVNGGSYDFDVSACCGDCTTAELRIATLCDSESLNPLSLQWSYWCDGIQIDAGTHNISAFCTSNDPMILNFDALPCFLQLQVSINNAGCDACGGGTDPCANPDDCVTVACCVDPVPKSLTMVVVGGACAGTYSLVWSSGSTWQDVGYACSAIELVCTGGVWTMSVDMIGITLISAICDPLEIVFDGALVGLTSVTVTA